MTARVLGDPAVIFGLALIGMGLLLVFARAGHGGDGLLFAGCGFTLGRLSLMAEPLP